MNFTLIQSLWTILVMVAFIGIVIWAWSGARRERFEAAARLPLEDDEPERAGRGTALSDHGSMK